MYAEPPLDPSADEARRWLSDELAKARYDDRPSLVERFLQWLGDRVDALTGVSDGLPAALQIVVLLVLAALVAFGLSRLRRNPGAVKDDEPDLLSRTETADDVRAEALAHERAGDLDAAFLAWFRVIALDATERAVVVARPGATAHEVAHETGQAFPDDAAGLAAAADEFDRLRYGGRHTTAQRVSDVRDLRERVLGSTPRRTEAVG